MSNAMINMWNRIKIVCMNHEEPAEMVLIENTEVIKTPFYACKHYGHLDNGTAENEDVCFNRLNLDDYKGVVLKFMDIIASEEFTTDFTNFKFTYKVARQKIKVKVLKYTQKEIVLGVLNATVLGIK